jgi:hypothetical protein
VPAIRSRDNPGHGWALALFDLTCCIKVLISTSDPDSSLHRAAPRGLEIRHLAALVAVATEQFLDDGARSICPRPVLRARVARLERAVGTPLLSYERGSTQAHLTEAGRLMLSHAEAVLARLEAARADVAATVEGRRCAGS